MTDLLHGSETRPTEPEAIAPGAVVLRAFALTQQAQLIGAVEEIAAVSPFRHMMTPGGSAMSVAMTNCGIAGWISERRGYRYTTIDPQTERPWPAMPAFFTALAHRAASACGYGEFSPDVCLINRYRPGARMSLHQDQDERDFSQPIVSVSLGLACRFLFGGARRDDKVKRLTLVAGDVVVWGGTARRYFHGVAPLASEVHPLSGAIRFNLTFRKAL